MTVHETTLTLPSIMFSLYLGEATFFIIEGEVGRGFGGEGNQ